MARSMLLAVLALSASTATALVPFHPREAVINHEPHHFDLKARDVIAPTSLGLAIDTTGSMRDYITALRVEIKRILRDVEGTPDQPSALVLSTFNDGEAGVGPVLLSSSQLEFGDALDDLEADGGVDCPELALTGIGKALEQLPEGGNLFVVTDASAKDAALVGQVISLARGKRIKVFFFLFDNICGTGEPAYTSIAHATGGQTHTGLTVADASLVAALIKALVRNLSTELVHLLPDATSPVTDLTQVAAPESDVGDLKKRYVSEVSFIVDPSITSVTVSVDSGRSVAVTRPDGSVVGAGDPNANIVVLSRGVVVVINTPETGTWTVTVSDCDECSVNVFGQSPIQFTFGLTQSTDDGFLDVTEAPVVGCTYRTVAEIAGAISNPTFEMRRANGELLEILPMTLGTGAFSDSYIGELTVPDGGFTIYLRGTNGDGVEILRVVAGIIRGIRGGTCPGAGTPIPSATVSDTATTEPPASATDIEEEPTETEPPVSVTETEVEPTETETEEEPAETEPPATTIVSEPPITSVRTGVSHSGVTLPSASGTLSTVVTDRSSATTIDATEVGRPSVTTGGETGFGGIRWPVITQGSNAVIICPGPHPVCAGVIGPLYPGEEDTVTRVVVHWTTVCPTVATVTSGTCTSLQTRLATVTSTLTVQSVIPCGSCRGHNHPQPPVVPPPCGGAPNCPHAPPPHCSGPHCPPPHCTGPHCPPPSCTGPDCHLPGGPVCPGPMCPHQPEGPVCPGPMCPHQPEEPVCPGPMCPHQPEGPVCPGPMCPHQPPAATGPAATNPGTPPVVTAGAAALDSVMLAQVYVVVLGVLLW
ncbi:hypothetical protein QBC39DRAFT_437217 [Podospora conica]|nr:hypothetical protein QBC39DRAFT_437217 [Schizothecium conicum]